MPDTSLHAALQAFVSEDEPPMGLTAAGVLAAGRRSRRRRRFAGFAGTAAVAVLVVAGLAAVPGGLPVIGHRSANFGALAPCSTPPGSRPAEAIDPTRSFSPALAAWATASLSCALADAVPPLLPAARFARAPGAPAGPLVGYTLGGRPPWGNRVDAMTLVHDRHGTGDLTVLVGVANPADAAGLVTACEQDPSCTVRHPQPGVAVIVGGSPVSSPDAERDISVQVLRGHTDISVQASNTDRRSVDGGPPVATRDGVILTADQLVDLALSPSLYLFP